MRDLCIACKGVEESLLEFANDKPLFTQRLKDTTNNPASIMMKNRFTQMLEKIMSFNNVYK